jgi:hypothetical protein
MATKMGLTWFQDAVFKRKFRWLFFIDEIVDDGVKALAPQKGSRPSISFKEVALEHLTETINFPTKPEWKTFQLTLFDAKCKFWPVWEKWLVKFYDPENGGFTPVIDASYKKKATLEMYDGCGKVLEKWTFENAYPSEIDFDTLDMDDNGIVYINLTLRYDRAYLEKI